MHGLLVELIDLDDVSARPGSVGAKAARLAAARRRGLPVLPGFVVGARPGRSLVASLLPELSSRGPYAAALRVMELVPAVVDFAAALQAAENLGPALAVRSSSPVEDDPMWSGAFSSFLDLAPGELVTAVAGCWASTLTPSVLARCERTERTVAQVCPAVLVQPMVHPEASGTATARRSARGAPLGAVDIVAVWGPPAPLLAGWSEGRQATVVGSEVTVPAAQRPRGGSEPSEEVFPEEWLLAVAALAREACEGAPATIEWAVVGGHPLLLQARPVAPVRPGAAGPAPDRRGSRPAERGTAAAAPGVPRQPDTGLRSVGRSNAARVARAVLHYGGPLGDRFVLPWLLGMESSAPAARGCLPAADGEWPMSRFEATLEAASGLVATAVGADGDETHAAASRLLARVRSGDLRVLGELRPVDAGAAAACLAGMLEVADALVDRSVLAHREQLWCLNEEEVRALITRPALVDWERHRRRTLHWQALVQGVVGTYGRRLGGEGVSAGRVVGCARRLSTSTDLRRVVPGDVVVVHRPSPQFAPALWVASGLVAESGSGAAHLVEVARSLRVPAVVGVGPLQLADGADLLLVDGGTDGESDDEAPGGKPGGIRRGELRVLKAPSAKGSLSTSTRGLPRQSGAHVRAGSPCIADARAQP